MDDWKEASGFDTADVKTLDCANCKTRKAFGWWVGDGGTMALIRGYKAPWCEHCTVTAQLQHARERAAEVPNLERRLAELNAEKEQP